MEATKERQQQQQRKGAAKGEGDSDTVQLPTETSPYVRYDGLEDYKMRGYGVQGHLPVSDVPHGGTGTEAPTVPGTAIPVAQPQRHDDVQPQRDLGGARGGGGGGVGRPGDTATDAINRHGVP